MKFRDRPRRAAPATQVEQRLGARRTAAALNTVWFLALSALLMYLGYIHHWATEIPWAYLGPLVTATAGTAFAVSGIRDHITLRRIRPSLRDYEAKRARQ